MPDDNEPRSEPAAESSILDQEFFLALAAKGKDAWNAWRRDRANSNVQVTFKGVDFSVSPRDQIDFSGFEFGDRADFSECIWRGVPWRFGDDFERGYGFGVRFDPKGFRPGRASFIGATFGVMHSSLTQVSARKRSSMVQFSSTMLPSLLPPSETVLVSRKQFSARGPDLIMRLLAPGLTSMARHSVVTPLSMLQPLAIVRALMVLTSRVACSLSVILVQLRNTKIQKIR